MTDEAQRIAMAEMCGWKRDERRDTGPYPETYQGWSHPKYGFSQLLPDYINDLNWTHEVEKVLNAVQRVQFYNHLTDVLRRASPVNDVREFDRIHASAAQRAEAFLRTLGLWDDSK